MNKIRQHFKSALWGMVGIILIVFALGFTTLLVKLLTAYVIWVWNLLPLV